MSKRLYVCCEVMKVMPIRVQDELPAVKFLRDENVFVMTTSRARSGNSSSEGADPEPDAKEDRDRKPVLTSCQTLRYSWIFSYCVLMRVNRVIRQLSIEQLLL